MDTVATGMAAAEAEATPMVAAVGMMRGALGGGNGREGGGGGGGGRRFDATAALEAPTAAPTCVYTGSEPVLDP
jgi:hypothetical protein